MSQCIIHPEVAGEIADAVNWYRAIDSDLGLRIHAEIFEAIEHAQRQPLLYRKIYRNYRRILCRNFPYRVVFEWVEDDSVVHVVAVLHQRRHPDVWKERLD